MKAMNARKGDEYYTPEWVYGPLGRFDADYCASDSSTIGERNYTRSDNGLGMDWNGFVWCNPPFSAKNAWIEKMKAHNYGILLLPASVSTPWFAGLALHCGHVFFIGRKVNFINGSSSNFGGTCLFPFGDEALSRLRSTALCGFLAKIEGMTARV